MILIEKEKALEHISYDEEWTEECINALPTIEIVRCRECRHRFVDGENVRFNVCELNHNKVQADDWFCADGERMVENDTHIQV